jgi:hypothetical protein
LTWSGAADHRAVLGKLYTTLKGDCIVEEF